MSIVKLSKTKFSGITLASAAAAILLSACGGDKAAKVVAPVAEKVAEVKCSGINSCKGTSACATATSACQGQNSCKGKGWIKATKADCEAKGGTVLS
ncbi:MAG: hypothetical protein V7749_13180 [Cocleimonas sp.]